MPPVALVSGHMTNRTCGYAGVPTRLVQPVPSCSLNDREQTSLQLRLLELLILLKPDFVRASCDNRSKLDLRVGLDTRYTIRNESNVVYRLLLQALPDVGSSLCSTDLCINASELLV